MDKDQYRTDLLMCWRLGVVSENIQTTEVLEAIEHAEAVGPYLDPTAFIQNGKRMREDKEMVQAVNHLRAVFRKLKAAYEERGEGS